MYKNYGKHDTKVRKIRISHTCNYCFAFSEIASPSVHTIVLQKYRFDLQIGCWSFTEITFLDSDQTELFAFSIKISRSWNFLTCFVYDFLKFNTTEIAELACALFYWFVQRKSVSVTMQRGRVFCSLLSIFTNSQQEKRLKTKTKKFEKKWKSRKKQFIKLAYKTNLA